MRKLLAGLATGALFVGLLASTADARPGNAPTLTSRVVAVSGDSGFDSNSNDFDVLREALVATGLAGALDGKGQFTVFAPTDQAFVDLVSGIVGSPVDEATAFGVVASLGLETVEDVLLYHVAPGRNPGGKVKNLDSVPTLLGPSLGKAGPLTLQDALGRTSDIVAADAIRAGNGVAHVIDTVVLPVDPLA